MSSDTRPDVEMEPEELRALYRSRLEDLYDRALRAGDLAVATAATRSLAALAGFNR